MRKTGWSPIYYGRGNLKSLFPSRPERVMLLAGVIPLEYTANNGGSLKIFMV